ncbi:NRDE family protein [Myxococcus sp. RHSTA-1-4]|uniref:NRDE family protein n=1 Tax=Myxococcus sp. RHSTA-1-4 TaxID=2874601 RepID=UPI001CBC44A7|nr:NRDE family protein [Myxococcus sp. RHSTA-1-4]MBZ4415695.1 NRDE family protein [Myxococcus sp. RHSTA-1-4]
MCTIVILRQVHPEWPLVLAANRDEFYARPATGPQILRESPRAVGGRDVERGGTWMGVTNEGLFVGLTNQRGGRGQGPAPRSRGEVVLRALEMGGVEAIERYLDTLPGDEFLPFNLLYGDARVLRVAYARSGERRLRREDVPPGIHVLPNDVLDAPALPKVERARMLAAEVAHRPWPELEAGLKALLADPTLPALEQVPVPEAGEDLPRDFLRQLQALCIRTPLYGTRSSTIVALKPGHVGHYLATEVAPGQGPWSDVTGLLTPGAAAANG